MPVKPLSEPTPSHQYSLYDVITTKPSSPLAVFDRLTGGEQTMSTISYQAMDANGIVTTYHMPGTVNYSPVSLTRPMDAGARDAYAKVFAVFQGKYKDGKGNYSISMNDTQGKGLVWWHLYGAIPISIKGFSFNMMTEHEFIQFEIELQAERIEIIF